MIHLLQWLLMKINQYYVATVSLEQSGDFMESFITNNCQNSLTIPLILSSLQWKEERK